MLLWGPPHDAPKRPLGGFRLSAEILDFAGPTDSGYILIHCNYKHCTFGATAEPCIYSSYGVAIGVWFGGGFCFPVTKRKPACLAWPLLPASTPRFGRSPPPQCLLAHHRRYLSLMSSLLASDEAETHTFIRSYNDSCIH